LRYLKVKSIIKRTAVRSSMFLVLSEISIWFASRFYFPKTYYGVCGSARPDGYYEKCRYIFLKTTIKAKKAMM
jgi:hypothetical protein